ncbi:MAG TPA: Crp/Fnr family transcriptional regulator [Gammaproteobacteria bacterium]|nr:Crp/Fnr family transcriptional regulator [Gammaproteobacteria bacterium]
MENVLKKIPIFADLKDKEVKSIASHAVNKTFPKNSIIINEGDDTNSMYVILSGKIKVFLSNEDGKEVILTMMGPGEYFGELAILDQAPRSASIMTMEPCKFSIISKNDFDKSLVDHPEIARTVITELTRMVRRLTDNIRNLALMDVYGRVAKTLLDMAEDEDGVKVINQKLTHQDIARMIGSSREMVSRIMKDLQKGGYITPGNKCIVINEKLPPGW